MSETNELNELITCCLDCEKHKVINDPDPLDSFCYDDLAVICTLKENSEKDVNSKYAADRNMYKPVAVSVRPYNLRKESVSPIWCPKRQATSLVT